jgi:hypothetical protein
MGAAWGMGALAAAADCGCARWVRRGVSRRDERESTWCIRRDESNWV